MEGFEAFKGRRKAKRKVKSRTRKFRKRKQLLIERAERALEKNLVINFTDVEVPKLSIAILSYGPGFITNPIFNPLQFKLDSTNASHKLAWRTELGANDSQPPIPPTLLKRDITMPCSTKNKTVNSLASSLRDFGESFVPRNARTNLNRFEKEGLLWLKKAIREEKIIVTSADKGGAVLIVTPSQMYILRRCQTGQGTRFWAKLTQLQLYRSAYIHCG